MRESIQDCLTLVCLHATKRRKDAMIVPDNKATLLNVRSVVECGLAGLSSETL